MICLAYIYHPWTMCGTSMVNLGCMVIAKLTQLRKLDVNFTKLNTGQYTWWSINSSHFCGCPKPGHWFPLPCVFILKKILCYKTEIIEKM